MSRELNYLRHPWRTRLGWIAVYTLLIIGCGIGFYLGVGRIRTHLLPVGGVQLSVPYSTYLVGEPVSFTITNNFNSAVFVTNKCPNEPLGVYRSQDGKWVRVHDTASKTCTAEDRQVSVPANKSLTMSLASWPHLFEQPGKYRIVVLVEYYNAIPYQDFSVIERPKSIAAASTSGNSSGSTKSTTTTPASTSSTPTTTSMRASSGSTPTPPTIYTPVNYTIRTTPAGVYDTTSLSLHTGDSITFVYNSSVNGEVRTRFTGSPAIASVTVDQEFKAKTVTFNTAGTWTFKADDHSGNTGTIVVK